MAIIFNSGDIVTNQKPIYVRWDDSADCGFFGDGDKNEEFIMPKEVLVAADNMYTDNTLVAYLPAECITGQICMIHSSKHPRPLNRAIITSAYTAYYKAKIVTLDPVRYFYIELPLIMLKKKIIPHTIN